MPEVYTLRAPENFNYTNARRSSPARVKSNRKVEKHYLRPNDQQRTPTYDLLKPPVPNNTKPKTPEYNRRSTSTNSTHQKPKASGTQTHSNSPSQKKITTYMVTASNVDHLVPNISPTPSPPLRSNEKKQFVTFHTITRQDEYEPHYSPRGIRYVPLSQSKATESINRSMNLYRFRRS